MAYQLPLGRVVGILEIVPAPAGTVSRVVYLGCYHVLPTADGRVATRCRDMDFMAYEDADASSPPSWMSQLLEMASRYCAALSASQVEERRVGARPMPADVLPVVSLVPGV